LQVALIVCGIIIDEPLVTSVETLSVPLGTGPYEQEKVRLAIRIINTIEILFIKLPFKNPG
jgi:hypothetical protein